MHCLYSLIYLLININFFKGRVILYPREKVSVKDTLTIAKFNWKGWLGRFRWLIKLIFMILVRYPYNFGTCVLIRSVGFVNSLMAFRMIQFGGTFLKRKRYFLPFGCQIKKYMSVLFVSLPIKCVRDCVKGWFLWPKDFFIFWCWFARRPMQIDVK